MNAEKLMKTLLARSDLIIMHQAILRQAEDTLYRGLNALNQAMALPAASGSREILLARAAENFSQVYTQVESYKVDELQDALGDAIREIKALRAGQEMRGTERPAGVV